MSTASTPPAGPATHLPHERLAHFPVALFATVMGMAGITIAWTKAHHAVGAPLEVALVLRWLASGLYLFLLVLYGAKWLRYPQAVKADWGHPVRMNFFPAISIGLLLLSIAWAPDAPGVASWMWGLAAALHLAFTLAVMGSWLHHTHYTIQHANPAWFIPVVGNILVPIAGVRFAPVDISWFFFSIGLVFWLVLMTIVLYRLFFHEPLPPRLMPTLFILVAPPSVGFLAYVGLSGQLDGFARVLYFTGLFLTLLLASQAVRFFRLPFFISAWAYSFPLAAMTIATFEMGVRSGQVFYTGLGWLLIAGLSAVVARCSAPRRWQRLHRARSAYQSEMVATGHSHQPLWQQQHHQPQTGHQQAAEQLDESAAPRLVQLPPLQRQTTEPIMSGWSAMSPKMYSTR